MTVVQSKEESGADARCWRSQTSDSPASCSKPYRIFLSTYQVAAQIVRLISANEWGVTTEFWHFDFSAYLKHSTYGIMGSYRAYLCTMLRKKRGKSILGSYGQKFGSKMRFRDSWNSWVRVLPVWLFWIWPRILAAVRDSCSEHISDPKEPNGKFMNSTPPFWDLSRESWDARSEPLPVSLVWKGAVHSRALDNIQCDALLDTSFFFYM